jgi:hypothetical protein
LAWNLLAATTKYLFTGSTTTPKPRSTATAIGATHGLPGRC